MYDRIAVMVNNSGYDTFGAFEAFPPDILRRQFHTNVERLMDVPREVIPIFCAQKEEKIMNITSAAGRMIFP